MARDHFSKAMYSPKFNAPGYLDTPSAQYEKKVYSKFSKIRQLVQKVQKKCADGRRTNLSS